MKFLASLLAIVSIASCTPTDSVKDVICALGRSESPEFQCDKIKVTPAGKHLEVSFSHLNQPGSLVLTKGCEQAISAVYQAVMTLSMDQPDFYTNPELYKERVIELFKNQSIIEQVTSTKCTVVNASIPTEFEYFRMKCESDKCVSFSLHSDGKSEFSLRDLEVQMPKDRLQLTIAEFVSQFNFRTATIPQTPRVDIRIPGYPESETDMLNKDITQRVTQKLEQARQVLAQGEQNPDDIHLWKSSASRLGYFMREQSQQSTVIPGSLTEVMCVVGKRMINTFDCSSIQIVQSGDYIELHMNMRGEKAMVVLTPECQHQNALVYTMFTLFSVDEPSTYKQTIVDLFTSPSFPTQGVNTGSCKLLEMKWPMPYGLTFEFHCTHTEDCVYFEADKTGAAAWAFFGVSGELPVFGTPVRVENWDSLMTFDFRTATRIGTPFVRAQFPTVTYPEAAIFEQNIVSQMEFMLDTIRQRLIEGERDPEHVTLWNVDQQWKSFNKKANQTRRSWNTDNKNEWTDMSSRTTTTQMWNYEKQPSSTVYPTTPTTSASYSGRENEPRDRYTTTNFPTTTTTTSSPVMMTTEPRNWMSQIWNKKNSENNQKSQKQQNNEWQPQQHYTDEDSTTTTTTFPTTTNHRVVYSGTYQPQQEQQQPSTRSNYNQWNTRQEGSNYNQWNTRQEGSTSQWNTWQTREKQQPTRDIYLNNQKPQPWQQNNQQPITSIREKLFEKNTESQLTNNQNVWQNQPQQQQPAASSSSLWSTWSKYQPQEQKPLNQQQQQQCLNNPAFGDQLCNDFALQGECHTNPNVMMLNCPKACDFCRFYYEQTPSSSPLKSDCVDRMPPQECFSRGIEFNGCYVDQTLAFQLCPATCGTCGRSPWKQTAPSSSSECVDVLPMESCYTQGIEFNGCAIDQFLSTQLCRATCGNCGGPWKRQTPWTESDCVDRMTPTECSLHREEGSCMTDPAVFTYLCPSTCNTCSGPWKQTAVNSELASIQQRSRRSLSSLPPSWKSNTNININTQEEAYSCQDAPGYEQNCQDWKSRCELESMEILRELCPRTCNVCTPNPPQPEPEPFHRSA